MGTSGLYRAVSVSSFKRYATYRAATAAGVFTNTVFGFVLAYTYIALWEQRPGLGGYDQAEALTFVWVGQAMIGAMALLGGGFQVELEERIRTGDIAIDLYRPADLQLWWLASELGRGAFQVLGRGVGPMVAGSFAFELALPSSPLTWLWFLLAVGLGIVVSFALGFLVALATFWLLDGAGMRMVSTLSSIFFSGMLLPLTVFPGGFGEVVRWLPWSAMLQVPADVLLGQHTGVGLLGVLGFSAAWAVVLLLVGRALQAAATRRVVAQGG
ncbi:ABC transporter permease [Streptomyces mayteni]